ncbi:hypothetical protein B0H14DRAFT_2742255 [Mycena olivaceomarginata]|nr:hypothetical protein B0H14DRAFT_2742255 [Mycena olivaceomarginata]
MSFVPRRPPVQTTVIPSHRAAVGRAVRRHRIYGRTDSRKYGTRHRTVQEVSATADGTAGTRPAYRTDPYRQSRLRPGDVLLLMPLVLFISVPNPTQSQSFLDIKLARILLGSVLLMCRPLHIAPAPPPGTQFSFYSTRRTDRIIYFIGLFACQFLALIHKVPQWSLIAS